MRVLSLLIFILVTSGPAWAEPVWCQRFEGGAPSRERADLALSKAHALRRFFGIETRYATVDQALAAALENHRVSAGMNLAGYAEALPDTCWIPAGRKQDLTAALDVRSGVAWVRPGAGRVIVPPGVKALVLDLRAPTLPGLPKGGLRAFVAGLVGITLPGPVIVARAHDGMTDEYLSDRNSFRNYPETSRQPDAQGTGSFSGPVYVFLGNAQSPEAAELAGSLRLGDRAALIGEPVQTAVAESLWAPVGNGGLAFRVKELRWGSRPWPDSIPADHSAASFERLAAAGEFTPPAAGSGLKLLDAEATRAGVDTLHPFRDVQPPRHGLGDGRAALLIAHGALRLFYPSFGPLGDRIDNRLHETLATVDQAGKPFTIGEERALLRRFGEALHDGHSFVFAEPADPAVRGYLPVVVESLGGKAYVRRSAIAGILPGDRILALGDKSVKDFYAEQRRRTSASTSGYRFDIMNRELTKLKGPTLFTVETPGQKPRPIEITPEPITAVMTLKPGSPTLRESGWMKEHPGVYYVNLSADLLTSKARYDQLIAEASKPPRAKRLILDMRGYPGISPPDIIRPLMKKKFFSPIFRYYHYSGERSRSLVEKQNEQAPGQGPIFSGTVALLLGPHTVSAAETLATQLVDAKRVTVYGQSTSAGSNGDIAGVQLPGALALTFSGMEVLHADRSRFLGVGIVPDHLVPEPPRSLRTAADPVLDAAARGAR